MNLLRVFSMMIALVTITAALMGCSDCDEVDALGNADYIGFIGDSIFDRNRDNCKDIGSQLSLLRGEYIENRAVGGAQLTGGGPKSVEEQFYELMDESGDEIDIIIIMGGGNDILNNILVCGTVGCPDIIDGIFETGYQLAEEAHSLGLEKLLYVGYEVGLPTYPFLAPILNPMMDRMHDEHDDMGVEFLDTRGIYALVGDAMIDGYHPTPSGSRKYAEAINSKLDSLGW